MHVQNCRAGHLGFAVLRCSSESYILTNLSIKITYFWIRPIKVGSGLVWSVKITLKLHFQSIKNVKKKPAGVQFYKIARVQGCVLGAY